MRLLSIQFYYNYNRFETIYRNPIYSKTTVTAYHKETSLSRFYASEIMQRVIKGKLYNQYQYVRAYSEISSAICIVFCHQNYLSLQETKIDYTLCEKIFVNLLFIS